MKVGDKFKKVYPFISCDSPTFGGDGRCDGIDGIWVGGCRKEDEGHTSEGGNGIVNYADDNGFIEYEVLAIVEMPRKYKNRILYRVTMIDPNGEERRSSKCHTVTDVKFKSWVEAIGSSYLYAYDILEG